MVMPRAGGAEGMARGMAVLRDGGARGWWEWWYRVGQGVGAMKGAMQCSTRVSGSQGLSFRISGSKSLQGIQGVLYTGERPSFRATTGLFERCLIGLLQGPQTHALGRVD